MKQLKIPFVLAFALLFLSLLMPKTVPVPEKQPVEKKIPGAMRAMDAWFAERSYPTGKLDMKAYEAGFQELQQDRNAMQKTTSTGWESLGPHNIGGRTLCLAFNPQNAQTLYAGSAGGGLWRSRTGGLGTDAWEYIPTGFPVIGVGAIAIDPVDTNTIYIGTGEVYNYQFTGFRTAIRTTRGSYGIGILKTEDGGATWTKVLDWPEVDMKGVQDMLVNPQNPKTVWAATTEGTYRSLDKGQNWTLVQNSIMASDLHLHPSDTNKLFLASGNFGSAGKGVYKSIDGGASFSPAMGGLPANFTGKILLSSTATGPFVLYASVADSLSGYGLYKSTDEGANWTLINNTDYQSYQGWYSHDVAVHPTNPNLLLTSGIDLYKSTDAGGTLTQKSNWWAWYLSYIAPLGGPEGGSDYVHADIHRVYWHPTDPNIAYFATDGGIFRTTDQAETFSGANARYQTVMFYANFSNSVQDSNFAIGGLQDNSTVVYLGDKLWRKEIGGDGASTAIHPFNDQTVYGSYQNLNILRSYDRAVTFDPLVNLPSGTSQTTNFIGPYELCKANPNVLYAGQDVVYKSNDGGDSWGIATSGTIYDGNPILKIAISSSNCDLVYVSNTPRNNPGAQLGKTTNGGSSWSVVTGSLPDRYYKDIEIDPNDNDVVYVAIGGYGTPHVYKTTDGGGTWTAKSTGLPDLPTNALFINPANSDHLYVGNDIGVYASTNGGDSWVPFSTDLPDAVMALDLSYSPSNQKLRVATHGSGVWESSLLPDSVIIQVNEPQTDNFELQVWPNPMDRKGSFRLKSPADANVKLSLLDLQGKVISGELKAEEVAPGIYEGQLPTEEVESGSYLLLAEGKQLRKTVRVLVQH